jgi:hypothetical protein
VLATVFIFPVWTAGNSPPRLLGGALEPVVALLPDDPLSRPPAPYQHLYDRPLEK